MSLFLPATGFVSLSLKLIPYPHLPYRHPLPLPNIPKLLGKRKKLFSGPEAVCRVDRDDFMKDLPSQKRAQLGLLYKLKRVDGKSVDDPTNFPKAPGVITCIRETGTDLKVWNHFGSKGGLFQYENSGF